MTVAVLKAMYAAEEEYLAAGGTSFAPLAPYFAEDVASHQADSLPYGGIWRGHEGMQEFFVAMSQTWESFTMVEQTFLADGETTVVHTTVKARARATGQELTFPMLQTIKVVEGKIAEVHPFHWDTEAIARACTPK